MWLRNAMFAGMLLVVVSWNTNRQRDAPTPAAPPAPIPDLEQASAKKPATFPKHYHNAAVRAFGQTPGFGKGRMIVMKTEIEDIVVIWSPREIDNDAPPIDVPDLTKMHRQSSSVLAWDSQSDPSTWLARPSRMASRHQDGSNETWVLNSVNLLALVDHEEPVVYITSKLPYQDEEHGVRKPVDRTDYTRPLDFLEIAALSKLQAGEEMFLRTKDDSLRMVGSLRASKQCLECHAGKEGDLFGAFSYTLTKVAR